MGFSEGSFDQSLDTSSGHHHRSMDQTSSLMNEENSSDAQFPDGDGSGPSAAKRLRM
jgi:hypothetical protein